MSKPSSQTPSSPASPFRILGIDPGYDRLGLAVIEKVPGKKDRLIFSDCLQTSAESDITERLHEVGSKTGDILDRFAPDCLSLETLFITKNQKTGMRVSEARGIIIYEAAKRKIPVYEYSPVQIKMAVTGDGRSDKERIFKMLAFLIDLPKKKALDDEYDAIAAALAHSAMKNSLSTRDISCKK